MLNVVTAPSFDIGAAMTEFRLLEERLGHDGPFSLSPLTSPESTPPSSPPCLPTIPTTSVDDVSLSVGPTSTPPIRHSSLMGAQLNQPSRWSLSKPAFSHKPNNPNPRKSNVSDDATQASKRRKNKPAHRKARQYTAYRAARAERRREDMGIATAHYEGHDNAWEKYVSGAEFVRSGLSMDSCRVSTTGYVGVGDRRKAKKAKKVYCMEQLTGPTSKFKFQKLEWDGEKPTFITDAHSRLTVICAGHPSDTDWTDVHQAATQSIEDRRDRCSIPKNKIRHRRGRFVSLACGISHGGGQEVPGSLEHNKANAEVLKELNESSPFQRLAGFASSMMATWTKDLHSHYSTMMATLHGRYPHLKRIFCGSVFCAVSYNFGPQTSCFPHRDFANLPYGLCAVTALGSFDHTKGGHLILWELGIIIEFPPGATILLPSALITHSNTLIAKHECRYSYVQYTAGALFRWVDHGCKTKEEFLSTLSPDKRASYEKENADRWAKGLAMLPMLKKPSCS